MKLAVFGPTLPRLGQLRGTALAFGLALLAVLSAGTLEATSIDFSTGAPGANMGSSLTFPSADPYLTITARSKMPDGTDPLFTSSYPGTIYWGDLGDLNDGTDCSGGRCVGLGVQNATGGGSKGISGAGPDGNEALLFSWGAGSSVAANTIKLLLIGINSGKDADVVDLFLEFYPVQGGSDVIRTSVSVPLGAPSWLDLSAPSLGIGSANTYGLAVVASSGHFGVGGISYESSAVPEPASLWLFGAGLGGILIRLIRKPGRR